MILFRSRKRAQAVQELQDADLFAQVEASKQGKSGQRDLLVPAEEVQRVNAPNISFEFRRNELLSAISSGRFVPEFMMNRDAQNAAESIVEFDLAQWVPGPMGVRFLGRRA